MRVRAHARCVHVLCAQTPTRKSFIDAIMAVCIPVVFRTDSVLLDSLPYADVIPYVRMVLHVPMMDELLARANETGAGSWPPGPSPTHPLYAVEAHVPRGTQQAGVTAHMSPPEHAGLLLAHLRAVPADVIRSKQELLRSYAPLLSYPYPKLLSSKQVRSEQEGRDNAVTLAIQRLAADVVAS